MENNNKKTIAEKIRDFFWVEVEEDSPNNDEIENIDIENTLDTSAMEDTIIKGIDTSTIKEAINMDNIEQTTYVDNTYFDEDGNDQSQTIQKQKFFIAAVLVFAVFVSSFSGYLFATSWFGGGIAQGDDGNPVELPGILNPTEDEEDNIEKILIIGVDQRAGEPSRADTMMLAIINTDNPELQLLSIPRDTRTIIPGRGYDKLNHAQAYGGPSLLMEAINDMLDIEIDGYVQLNFNSFKEIIDILGGVEYNVEIRMYNADENINLQPGKQVLDGDKALQYVRYRNSTGDIGRVERQQKFVRELIDQKLKLRNVLKIPELVGEAHRSVKTNISLKDMVSIAMAMKELENEKVTSEILPGKAQYINGVSYWLPEDQKLEDIFPENDEGNEMIEE